jgi:nitrate reductase assembly molybdenum cofactor insertion protein NarJ
VNAGSKQSNGEEARQAVGLACVYGAIGEWMLYPDEIGPESFAGDAVTVALGAARLIDADVEEHLRSFLDQRETVDAEEYVNLFELSPRCPLYLGAHQFEEPKTCTQAGLSDRNTFMLEIANIYRHFGVELHTELPDYLPAMTEFLAITAGCPPQDDEVRIRLIDKLMIDGVRLMATKLETLDVPQGHLVEALIRCLEVELAPLATLDLVGAVAGESPPAAIQVEGVPAHE